MTHHSWGRLKPRTPKQLTELRRIRGRYPGYTRARLKAFSSRLARVIHPDKVPAIRIEMAGPTERISFDEARNLTYREVTLGTALGPLWSTYWFRVTCQVPDDWADEPVDLYWDSRSEALLWLGGKSSRGLNIGRNIARLLEQAEGGEFLTFHIEVACNRAFGAAEDLAIAESATEHYRLSACELRRFDPEAWALFHDFDVLRQLEADREPPQAPMSFGEVAPKIVRPALDTTWAGRLLHELNKICNELDPHDRTTWPAARDALGRLLSIRNGDLVHELSAIGHAHIDTAWLWPIEETRRKCQRSFATAVALMDDYPDFKFACSQAYQYAEIEKSDADLFARIRGKVESGQWVVIGGSWVEPDCNLPSGESLCRQFLYGQRYFERVFGARSTIFWNPDVFGYAAQLPQLMREAGMTRFLTQKLSWNRFTSPPHHSFHWRGLDGSAVLAHFPPADTYNGSGNVEELRYHAANYKDADRTTDALYLFGFGDGGGGPNAGMIETLRRTKDLLGVPRCTTRTPGEFFDRLERNAADLAMIEGELYFEYHRGTYTSQAEVKRLNRLAEGRLQTLEYLIVAADLAGNPIPDRREIEDLWCTLLVNQFHDILPGSSIGEVYTRTRRELEGLVEEVETLAQNLLDELSSNTPSESQPHPINAIGFPRAEIAEAPDGSLHYVTAVPFSAGQIVSSIDMVQVSEEASGNVRLENAYLIAILSPEGLLLSLIHKASGREAMASPGNRIVLYDDRPITFEAWDIDPFALETAQDAVPSNHCTILTQSPLRAEVQFERRIGGKSRMIQTVRLDAASEHLTFDTFVDWHERRTLLKVVFPIDCRSSNATYETMFGAVERPTHANTDADLAQYEVPGHRWSDLSEPGFGVSLLSDSRYGYSTFDGQMALSLLRGPLSPDPKADIGEHRFRYALYPHAGTWREAGTIREAVCFNRPVHWANGEPAEVLRTPLVVTSSPNVVIDTIKPAEDGQGWVVRLYESFGNRVNTRLTFGVPVSHAQWSNTLEDRLASISINANSCTLDLRPYQIATLRLN